MNLELPIHLAFKKETDIISRFQLKLRYHFYSSLTYKTINKFLTLSLMILAFTILPLFQLLFFSLKKSILKNRSNIDEIIPFTCFISVLFIFAFHSYIYFYDNSNFYFILKMHFYCILGGLFLFLSSFFLFHFSLFMYANTIIKKISIHRNNEFTPFFLGLKRNHSFSFNIKILNDSAIFFNLFYLFYKEQYPESKHLFLDNPTLLNKIRLLQNNDLYTYCLKDNKYSLFFNFNLSKTSKEVDVISNEITNIISNHKNGFGREPEDFYNLIKSYLQSLERSFNLNDTLQSLSNKTSIIRAKKKI